MGQCSIFVLLVGQDQDARRVSAQIYVSFAPEVTQMLTVPEDCKCAQMAA